MTFYKVGRYKVRTTSEQKILFPEAKITKEEFIIYYLNIADIMMPYIKNRAITMHRFVDGIDKEGFYQKNAPDYFPEWIKRYSVEKKDGEMVHYVVMANEATLIYLANQCCITPHIWLSKVDKPHYPDQMIFDLDPIDTTFATVKKIAKQLKKLCDILGIASYIKTTGSKGLHVSIPLKRTSDFDTVRECAQDLAQVIVDANPNKTTLEIRKEKRQGKIFIDTLRNSFGATAVAPYAVRAKPKAPIATPILWDELDDKRLKSDSYTIKNIFKRPKSKFDPWKDMHKHAVTINTIKKALKKYI